MLTQIKIENCEKPFCVIHAQKETEGISRVAEKSAEWMSGGVLS